MKLTNQEIFNAKVPLEKLLAEKLPVKTSYGLAKLAAKLNDQLGIIDKVRQGLFQTYGAPNPQNPMQITMQPLIEEKDGEGKVIKDAEGNPVMISNPKFPKFAEEMGELMTQEAEIVFEVVTLPDTLEVEPTTLMMLDKFIKV